MGQYPSRAFLTWRRLAEARDWDSVFALLATPENRVVLWAMANLPTWGERVAETQRLMLKAALEKD